MLCYRESCQDAIYFHFVQECNGVLPELPQLLFWSEPGWYVFNLSFHYETVSLPRSLQVRKLCLPTQEIPLQQLPQKGNFPQKRAQLMPLSRAVWRGSGMQALQTPLASPRSRCGGSRGSASALVCTDPHCTWLFSCSPPARDSTQRRPISELLLEKNLSVQERGTGHMHT